MRWIWIAALLTACGAATPRAAAPEETTAEWTEADDAPLEEDERE